MATVEGVQAFDEASGLPYGAVGVPTGTTLVDGAGSPPAAGGPADGPETVPVTPYGAFATPAPFVPWTQRRLESVEPADALSPEELDFRKWCGLDPGSSRAGYLLTYFLPPSPPAWIISLHTYLPPH